LRQGRSKARKYDKKITYDSTSSSIIIKITVVSLAKCIMVKKTGNKSGVLGDFIKVAIKKSKNELINHKRINHQYA
jgi:hypothetical protein